jgi:hypothetical protein
MKLCCKCKTAKPTTDFYANKRMKDGLNTFCILCHKADNVARKKINRAKPEFKAKELAWKKLYRERTVEQRAAYISEWRNQNREYVLTYGRDYRKKHKERYNYLCQLRKISLLQRTPNWLTDDDLWMIEQAYELASLRTKMFGFKWHVDHVIPLRGKQVSGLHVPTNLQVIPQSENQRKTNKFEVSYAS